MHSVIRTRYIGTASPSRSITGYSRLPLWRQVGAGYLLTSYNEQCVIRSNSNNSVDETNVNVSIFGESGWLEPKWRHIRTPLHH